VREQESLANAKVSARQQCVYEGPQRRNLRQIKLKTRNNVENYGSIFIRLAVIASQICEITRNSPKIRPHSGSRSSKVIDLGANRKLISSYATSY